MVERYIRSGFSRRAISTPAAMTNPESSAEYTSGKRLPDQVQDILDAVFVERHLVRPFRRKAEGTALGR